MLAFAAMKLLYTHGDGSNLMRVIISILMAGMAARRRGVSIEGHRRPLRPSHFAIVS